MQDDFKLLDVVETKSSPRARKHVVSVAVQFRDNLAIGYITVTFDCMDRNSKTKMPKAIRPHRSYCPNDARLCRIIEAYPENEGDATTLKAWLEKTYPGCKPKQE
jgi:hypothetical protein